MSIKEIKELNEELDKYKNIRQIINENKQKKDFHILTYMKYTRQPKTLDISLINYRALYLFFKKNFIEYKKILKFEDFFNGIRDKRSEIFIKKFGNGKKKEILIAIKETNFPHLIGYENENKSNRKFLDNIYYEVDLIENYQVHKCDSSKIQSISWIWDTLKRPYFVFDSMGIKTISKLKKDTDLVFVTSKKNNNTFVYHYVALKNISNECKNRYVINSHHKLTENEFYRKFKKGKEIYRFSKEVKDKSLKK